MNLQISHARCRCISHNQLRLALWLSVIRNTSDKMLYVPYRFSVLCKLNRLFSGISPVNLGTFRYFGLHNVFGFFSVLENFWGFLLRVRPRAGYPPHTTISTHTHPTRGFAPSRASPPPESVPLNPASIFFSLFFSSCARGGLAGGPSL